MDIFDNVRWDILIATTSVGICAGCAYLIKQTDNQLSAVSHAPSFSTVSRLIDYLDENKLSGLDLVSVTGKVTTNDSTIRSKHIDNLEGVLSERRVIEHKSEWSSGFQRWYDAESLISLSMDQVPFSLTDGVNNISVFSANMASDVPVQIVFDKFEPKPESGVLSHLVDHAVGSHLKGHQYLEKLLTVDTILTCVGTVNRSDYELSISPPQNDFPFILSRKSLSEICQDLRNKTFYPKVFMYLFGGIATVTVSYMLWKKWKKFMAKRRQDKLLREMEDMRDSNGSYETCVICLDNPRGTVLVPCGHVCMCLICADNLQTCPVCRQDIERIVRTYNA